MSDLAKEDVNRGGPSERHQVAVVVGLRRIFLRSGVLPFVLIASVIAFGVGAPRFLTLDNLYNILRQSSYLVVISMGQMLTLLVRGIDMSVGSTVALVSVVCALTMAGIVAHQPEAANLAIAAGMAAGIGVGLAIGLLNGIGIAVFRVNPFIMTVGTLSIASGVALKMSDGTPVYGMPRSFTHVFSYSDLFGIPSAVIAASALFAALYFVLYHTRLGRHIYAIGGDRAASHLAGINTVSRLLTTYVICSLVVAFGGVLVTARVGSGEAALGSTFVLQSITAVVIAGVSFFGGIGRLGNVVLGAIFVTLMTNGMDLNRIDSYVQEMVLGFLLIGAVVIDQIRMRALRQQQGA
jgi:ribose/xylose/arabinose/galactoside ABC-type transport system permease subunit